MYVCACMREQVQVERRGLVRMRRKVEASRGDVKERQGRERERERRVHKIVGVTI